MKLLKQFKKLNRDEINELIKRMEQINSFVLVVQGLQMQKSIWLNNKIKEKGLDQTKNYNIDFKSGALIPAVETKTDKKEDLNQVLPSK